MGGLNPQTAALLEGVFKAPAVPAPLTVEEVRAGNDKITQLLVGPGEEVFRIWDSLARDRGRTLALRWYRPTAEPPSRLTIFVHGGGWVGGTLDSYDALCRSLALRSGALVVSVGYSLSPETRFPTALDEVCLVLGRAKALAAEFGYISLELSVAGDSAGGQLIATALHRIMETGAELPKKAVFLYPATDASMRFPSWVRLANGYNLTAAKMRWFWEQYVGPTLAAQAALPELSPLRSPHLAEFPRSLVVTAEFDLLSDEGRAFAQQLAMAGANVELLEVPGQIHGFLRLRKVLTDPEWGADAVMERVGAFLRG